MASKDIAISKKIKISEAQQRMFLAVLGASVCLGAAAALTFHFIKQISFNTRIIMAEEAAIADYSDVIKNTGTCQSPKGDIYSSEELKNCNPSNIEISEVPNTLRSNVLEKLASDKALNSVPKQNDSNCMNPSTNSTYTYKELKEKYDKAKGDEELATATQLIKSCSALRVIPDALPAFKNEEALLASLNKLFKISEWEPESISPSGDDIDTESLDLTAGANPLSVNIMVEANSGTTTTVLSNIEKSIREFDFQTATIEWGGNDKLILRAKASAYYTDRASISESVKTVREDE